MLFERPIPTVGDTSAASQRAADPAGWAFAAAERDALHAVINARRDVRRFRPDPVPDEMLHRMLAAAHAAPSVGHSQPWRFIVVRDPARRERAALLADRERLRQAALLEPDASRRMRDLQLDGIREAPIGVVVCCDRRTHAAGVLGRATFPDADIWSSICAIQNLWLAARAEGIGLGWVTLFQPAELAELVGLPDQVMPLGWLCLGWPDERPPAPGLERAGWSRKLPLEAVVCHERWPSEAEAPIAPTSHLRAPDQSAVVGARDEADRLLTPPGSLGVLDKAVDRLAALGHGDATTATLVLVAADHPVAHLGVTAYPVGVTRQVLLAAAEGVALGVVSARAAGLDVHLVDAGVTGPALPSVTTLRPMDPQGDLATTDALSMADTVRLVDAGRSLGRAAAVHGLVTLGEVGIGNTTVAACLTAAMLGEQPAVVAGLGAGADSAMVTRKRDVITRALQRQGGSTDPMAMLAAFGGPEIAVLTGVTLGAAEAGAAIVLDGLATSVAALTAVNLEPAVAAHLIAGQRSRERAHHLVLTQLGLEPLLDLRIRSGEGVGASLACGVLLHALAVRRGVARVSY